MKIEFIKSHKLPEMNFRKLVIGQKLIVGKNLGDRLLNEGVAREYFGDMRTKTKTDFFKPK